MTHREKVDHLINDLAARGVSPFTAAPPTWRLLWALGIPIPPPLFMGTVPLILFNGVFAALLVAGLMWLGPWRHKPPAEIAAASVVAGAIAGSIAARPYRRAAETLGLPRSWDRYPTG